MKASKVNTWREKKEKKKKKEQHADENEQN